MPAEVRQENFEEIKDLFFSANSSRIFFVSKNTKSVQPFQATRFSFFAGVSSFLAGQRERRAIALRNAVTAAILLIFYVFRLKKSSGKNSHCRRF
jgi:hypothetical protein